MSVETAWAWVGGAIGAEIAAALLLRASDGFRRVVPTLCALGAFSAAFYLVSRALLALPVSSVYPVWAGGGTAGVAVLGIMALGERVHPLKTTGVALVVAGIVTLNLAGAPGA
ncbi:MAG: SMR family transporter [Gammaproteobacteria bacterium]